MNISLIFKYYWPHIKKYKKSALLVFVSYGIALASTSIVSPLLYKRIVDAVAGASDPMLVSTVLFSTLLLLGVNLISYNIFFRLGDYAMTYAQSHILKNVADDAFERLQYHSYDFFTSTFIGALVARMKRYVNAFETITDQIVFALWMGGLKIIFFTGVLIVLAPILAGIFFVWLALYIILTIFFTKKKIKKDLLTTEANSRVTSVLADTLTNALNIKIFASQGREEALFADATREEEAYRRSAWFFQNKQFAFQGIFIGIFEFIGMYAAISLWTHGYISAGTIVLMQIYILSSFDVVWNISRNFTKAMHSFAEAKEMVDIFEKPPAVSDSPDLQSCVIRDGHIRISNISFAYGGGNPIFKDFSLEIAPGEKVGLVGRSGAGKSTITKLLLRFVEVGAGEITIDGQDISRITQNDLRLRVSYVPQDAMLFHRTLRENIAYACADATNEDIIRAAKRAHADDFIQKLPKGYDTLVGERGVKLSGGERQRVAIARVMLKNAPILILDEATSSLDSESEKYIQDSLHELMEGHTTLVIAHRLSTLQKMDRIVVLDKGMIIESGTHRELLEKKGLYYDLWKHQNHGFVE